MTEPHLTGQAAVAAMLGRKRRTTTQYDAVLDPNLADEYREAQEKANRAQLTVDVTMTRYAREGDGDVSTERLDAVMADRDEAERHVARLRARLEDGGLVRLYFRSIGRPAYDALVRKYPSSKRQREDYAKAGHGIVNWDPDRFPAVLIAASAYVPTEHLCSCGEPADRHPTEDGCKKHDGKGDLDNNGIGDEMMTEDEAKELWGNPDWNGTELTAVFLKAQEANVRLVGADLGKAYGPTPNGDG